MIRDPKEISLGDVMSVIDGQSTSLVSNANRGSPTFRALAEAWTEVARVEEEMLFSITFADLLERVKGQTENMYYI